ncbi:MAG: GMC family oxidoreductase N-terminal domain-containing protein [Vicinamibacterales bacterium]
MSRVVIVGSGAGGATVARELAGRHDVTVLESGGDFRPFGFDLDRLARARWTGAFYDARLISFLFPAMRVRKASSPSGFNRMILVSGACTGGTTTVAAGNAVRADDGLEAAGIDLDDEFRELAAEIPVTTDHSRRWGASVRRLAEVCAAMGLDPAPAPKFGDYSRCRRCGRCVLGCPAGAKWDARRLLEDAKVKGARVRTGWTVDKLVMGNRWAAGVRARCGLRRSVFEADIVILAAGGFGTPAILERSGIECDARLFVDPVLCVAARSEAARLDREISMPFIVRRDGYIIAPYMDWLSFFFDPAWRMPAADIVPLMIKIADEDRGKVGPGGIEKPLTERDRRRLAEGAALCGDILERIGAPRKSHFLGMLNAGHPGGALPAGAGPQPFHDPRLPPNVWVADASLLPSALGLPPMLTVMAMAKRVARLAVASR